MFEYAFFNGDSAVGYRDVRQKIVDFIRNNCYKGKGVDAVVDDSLRINGKKVSDCSVDEVYIYVVNQIIDNGMKNRNLAESLLNDSDIVYAGYIEYLDMMVGAGVPEKEYVGGLAQFKDRLLDILKAVDGSRSELEDVVRIMADRSFSYLSGVNGVNGKEVKAFIVSCIKFELDQIGRASCRERV